jgi:hypothetical protein
MLVRLVDLFIETFLEGVEFRLDLLHCVEVTQDRTGNERQDRSTSNNACGLSIHFFFSPFPSNMWMGPATLKSSRTDRSSPLMKR